MPPPLVPARRLTIHLALADKFHDRGRTRHTPLCAELVLRAHRAGMAGATTVQGIAGYGHSHKVHHAPVWGLVDRSPVIVMIVDSPERIDEFIADNSELFRECLATVSDLEMIPRPDGRAGPGREDT
jgi:PII-like signaling protein